MKKAFKPRARAYADDAPLTKAELKRLRPAREVDPALVAAYERGTLRYRGQRGHQKAPTKVDMHIRVSPEVVAFFKSKGPGWQTRMNQVLESIVAAAR
jgi:uncharacterized protein (DUF4415 family)